MDFGQKRDFKNQLYEQFARIGKALASGRRIELLELLAQGERSVEALASQTDLSIANASQHLQVLRAAGLIEVRREGTFAFYRIAPESFTLWQSLRQVGAARLLEIEHLVSSTLGERSSLESVSLDELRRRLEQGEVILLDVRPVEEFRAAHIPGARSLPITSLEQQLATLPTGTEIVAYCRGPYCVFADEAIHLLRAKGFTARRLEAGLPDWRAAGFPVAQALAA